MRRSGILVTLTACALIAGGCPNGSNGDGGDATNDDNGSGGATEAIRPADERMTAGLTPVNNPADIPVRFEPPLTHFGVFEEGASAAGRVRVYNEGSRTLTITESITSCGCTETEDLRGRQIAPGESTEFGVSIKLKPGTGEKREGVHLRFDGYAAPVTYMIYAEAARPVRVLPPYLMAVQTLSGEVTVESLEGEPFTILAAHGEPPQYLDFNPSTDAPKSSYRLAWDVSGYERAGDVPWFWVIETDHPEAPVVDVRIRHNDTRPTRPAGRPWAPRHQRVLLDIVEPGEPVEFEVAVEYNANATPARQTASVTSSSPNLDAELIGAEVDGQFLNYRVRLTPTGGEPGLYYELFTMHASGFEADVRAIGRIAE